MENNKKLNNRKTAMTLAEILIVVVIVAIIGSVLISMPKRNVAVTDRAKYYMAYMTLQRLLNEQMAESGKIALRAGNSSETCSGNEEECSEILEKINNDKSLGQMVGKWLNASASCNWTDGKCIKTTFNSSSSTNAILTNGMYLDWGSGDVIGLDKKTKGITTKKAISVDIDGVDEGKGKDKKDKHYFHLYRANTDDDIRVKPISGDDSENDYSSGRENLVDSSNSSWINFKVFRVADDGKTKIILLEQDYTRAYNCYEHKNAAACGNNCEDEKCFIEPLPPLK